MPCSQRWSVAACLRVRGDARLAWTSNKPPMTWEDAESRPLEGQLAEIATQILVMGERCVAIGSNSDIAMS